MGAAAMKAPSTRSSRRRAVTIVECALVISICLLFLYGLFEYGRFLMARHMLESAAREGARFAVTHTDDTTAQTDFSNQVTTFLFGLDGAAGCFQNVSVTINGYTNNVYVATATNATGDANQTNQIAAGWTQAAYTDGIVVQVQADYHPVLPKFLLLNTSIRLTATADMFSEGN
jgi:Flp pilus assembly protein TadG